ncbi:hypothetical protein Bbelb_330890 [Branchiostoma belcheri]|nr:hypothetical protein Bbelb_330890 [Branchiostoma belcheri]
MDCSGVAPLPWLVLTLLSTVSAALYRTRPESTEVLVNQTVTLYCAFNGLAPSDVVNWYWYNPEADDKLYHISARGRVASEFSRHSIVGSSRRGEYNLRIRDVQPGDEGNYRCSVFTVRDAGDARLTVVVHKKVSTYWIVAENMGTRNRPPLRLVRKENHASNGLAGLSDVTVSPPVVVPAVSWAVPMMSFTHI